MRIWDAATGRQRAILKGHTGRVEAVAVAPDGSWLAYRRAGTGRCGSGMRPAVRQRATLKGHTGRVEAVAVAPDGSWLATGGWDGTVRIWDAGIWQARALMRVDGNVYASAWVGSDNLAVGGSAGLYLFGFLTGTSHVA